MHISSEEEDSPSQLNDALADRAVVYRSLRVDAELLVTVNGRFDGSVAPRAYEDAAQALDDGVTDIVIDLSDADEIDEGAVAVLCALAITATKRGGKMFLWLSASEPMQILDPSEVREALDAG